MKKVNQTGYQDPGVINIPNTPWRFLWFVSKPFLKWVYLAFTAVFVGSVVGFSIPLLYKWVIEAVESGNYTHVLWLGLAYPFVVFMESNIWRISGVFGMHWSINTKQYANDVLVEYTLKHSHDYFSNRFAGSLLNKAGNVIGGIERMIHDMLWSIVGTVIGVLVTILYLYLVDPQIAFIFIAFLFTLLTFNRFRMKGKRDLSMAQAIIGSRLRGQIADMLSNASVIRQYTGLPNEVVSMNKTSTDWRLSQKASWSYGEMTHFLNGFLLFIFSTGLIYVLILGWQAKTVSTGDFIFVMALIGSLVGRLVFVGRVMSDMAKVLGEVSEGLKEIVVPHAVVDRKGASSLAVTEAKIEIKNLSFTYDNIKVFNDFNLTIQPGERVGLVGPSGAGKSTLVSLLLRQFDVQAGDILIDNQNIASVTQASLRASMAVVPQEPALFHRTIRENIAYGKPEATLEEVMEVAKKAEAHDFIMALPNGYDTLVGERGVKLSGGQKQRVAIARAMIKDAPILILDEATSALDSESEVEIQKALHFLMAGKTVIAIAHRLSTLREMDRIIVLENGKIVEDGTHENLKNYGGTYQRLWDHQAGGFMLE